MLELEYGTYSFNGHRYGVSARASSGMRAFGTALVAVAWLGDYSVATGRMQFYAACAGFTPRSETFA